MCFGSDLSQSSNGWSASTIISSLPLVSRRTTPGLSVDNGISIHSRLSPSESVTPRIRLICLNDTTSNGIDAPLVGILDFRARSVNERTSGPHHSWWLVHQNTREDLAGFFDHGTGDIQMGDGTKTVAADGIDQNPLLLQGGDDRRWSHAVADDLEDDNIRVDILSVNLDRRNLLELSSQSFRVVMVYFQSTEMVFQCVDACGGEDAGLPHGTAIHPPQPFSLI